MIYQVKLKEMYTDTKEKLAKYQLTICFVSHHDSYICFNKTFFFLKCNFKKFIQDCKTNFFDSDNIL